MFSSPLQRYSHLPEPIKKAPLDSPTDKPLPSLPIATCMPKITLQRRSLLDATERPLRRSVSPGTSEDWPALSPAQITAPDSPIAMDKPAIVKASLGESVIERMQNLSLDDDGSMKPGDILSERRKMNNFQNHADKKTVVSQNDRRDAANGSKVKKSLDPHPAPETPQALVQRGTSSKSSVGQQSSLSGLTIFKSRRHSQSIDSQTAQLGGPKTQQSSKLILLPPLTQNNVNTEDDGSTKQGRTARGISGGSNIPRLRGISATGSPYASSSYPSPKISRLRHIKGQIPEVLQAQDTDGTMQIDQPCDPSAAESRSYDSVQFSSSNEKQDSLPTPVSKTAQSGIGSIKIISTRMQPDTCDDVEKEQSRTSSSATTIKQEIATTPMDTPSRKSSVKENMSPTTTSSNEGLSPARCFKFPATSFQEDINDDQSETTCVTSLSGVSKAGTVYGQDEYGEFRLKPISKADPKHGPRVRIEESADRLLLDSEQLAKIEAKREAYKRRFTNLRETNEYHENKDIVAELASVRIASDIAPAKIEDEGMAQNSQIVEDDLDKQKASENGTRLNARGRLAPPIPLNIPILTHSPTGWPLQISKIAPFAELKSDHAFLSTEKRKSASESNLRPHGPQTPLRNGHNPAQHSPSSAYTLRTALRKVSREADSANAAHKPQPCRSLPEITSKPLLPVRTSSKASNSFNAVKGSLREKTSGILRSYVNQRAALKATGNGNPKDGFPSDSPVHSLVTSPKADGLNYPPVKQMQTYNNSVRNLDIPQDTLVELPSSPLAVPNLDSTGKPVKMISRIGGIFYQPSKDGTLFHSNSRGSISDNFSSNMTPEANATLRNMGRRNAIAVGMPTMATITESTNRCSPNFSPQATNNTSHVSPAGIYHGTVKEASTPASPNSSLKRRFPRLGNSHKHSATHPVVSTTAASQRNLSPQFVTSALEPVEIRDATTLAFNLLDRARDVYDDDDTSVARRQEYVELAKVIVSTVTFARDAEKAKEEARQAAARAEVECANTRRAVAEVCAGVTRVIERLG